MKEYKLEGSFYEIGYQYGSHCRRDIKNFLFMTRVMAAAAEGEGRDFFRPELRHIPGALLRLKKYRGKYRRIAVEFEENIQKHYPEILDMVKGMADSCKVDYRDIIFMNCMTEYSLKCSTIAAAGKSTEAGHPLLAMNADESKFVQNYEVLLHIKPDRGYEYKAVFMAGTIFPNFGMNCHGLSMVSELLFLDNNDINNIRMPMILKYSVLHRCRNSEEAKQVINSIPPAGIGTAAYIADSEKMIVIEENARYKNVGEIRDGYYYNCNLPHDEALKKLDKRDDKNDIQYFFAIDRERRLASLLEKMDGSINEKELKNLLSDHGSETDGTLNKSICIHPENTKGIKTCVSFIGIPAERRFVLFEGNPCQNNRKEHRF